MAANVSAMTASFKSEAMSGIHALGTSVIRAGTTADTLKAALYLVNSSIGVGTTAYSATGEVSGTNYTAGGIAVTNATAPNNNGTSGYWTPSASLVWTTVTLSSSFDCVLLYNSTQSNKSIAAYNFGAQTVTAGTLTLTMPTNAVGTALLQIT